MNYETKREAYAVPRGPLTERAVGNFAMLFYFFAGLLGGIIVASHNPLLNSLVFLGVGSVIFLGLSFFRLREAIQADALREKATGCSDPNCQGCRARRALESAGVKIPPGAVIGFMTADDAREYARHNDSTGLVH